MKKSVVDLCIIGAGAGGLSVAAVATQLGITTAIVEQDKMGGDCLNYGCVPSKSLLAAAKVADNFRKAEIFGIKAVEPTIDFTKVMAHVQGVINAIAPHDSRERFEKLGAKVFSGSAKFVNKRKIIVGDQEIKARHFIIATGSSPAVPAIPGLDQIPYFTNETIFSLQTKPQHLLIIGGGPIGCELAQAFLLLGVPVTIIEAKNILPHDDADLVKLLRAHLLKDGLTLYENAKIFNITTADKQINVAIEVNGEKQTISGSHLLVATGRRANVKNLNLSAAGVQYTDRGITVDERLRTSNHKIYALGDVTGGFQFTHIANYHAGIVIRNLLFRIPTKVNYRTLPWVTYTQPELAHVGLTEAAARKNHPDTELKIITCPFTENDRAQTAHETFGQIKLIADKKGQILGVSILGAEAGELLGPWLLAMAKKMKVRDLTGLIIPYPTLNEINKLVASNFYKDLLFSNFTKKIVRFLKFF